MKTNILLILAFMGLITFESCNNQDSANDKIPEVEKQAQTEFSVLDNTLQSTRTSGEYTGTGIKFYWTEKDKLWIYNSGGTPELDSSFSSNIAKAVASLPKKRIATADFYFEKHYEGSSYPVRYTGANSTAGDKVTFADKQNQAVTNDASHIGISGDCGTAIATKMAKNKYKLTLDHKAAYLTFMPYSSIVFANSVKVTQIKVTADKAISGQFDFNDNGIDLNSRPATTTENRTITLTLAGGGTDGFILPSSPAKEYNAAIMVLPPGDYATVDVEYTLYDQATTMGTTIKKQYTNLTLNVGKNKKVSTDIQMRVHQMSESTWPGWVSPNINEALWYVQRGDVHLDTTVYARRCPYYYSPANIFLRGIWIKKKAYISGYNASTAPDGTNQVKYYNTGILTGYASHINGYAFNIPIGDYSGNSAYYFLPYTSATGLRYWIGTRFYGNGVQGQVLASDYNPTVKIGNIGIGCNYSTVTMGYWPVQ